jgi:hypothetical protein
MKDDRYLVALALGTFHAVILALQLVLGLYHTTDLGHLLASLNSTIGLAVFAVLWATSVYCTHRGLQDAGLAPGHTAPADSVLNKGLAWGAWNGMLFFWCILGSGFVVLLAISILDSGFNFVFGVVIFAMAAFAVGSLLAAGIGAATGILLAALDIQLLRVARSLVGASNPTR